MKYTESQLEDIKKLASIFVAPSIIADVLGVDANELKEDLACRSSAASIAYRQGKAASIVALRNQEMQLARVGSPTAVENVGAALLKMEEDE